MAISDENFDLIKNLEKTHDAMQTAIVKAGEFKKDAIWLSVSILDAWSKVI